MKVQGRVYRGIEYINIQELPIDQQQALHQSPSYPERVKIMIEGKILDGCLLYRSYLEWYVQVYKAPVVQSIDRDGVSIKVGLRKH